MRGNPVDDGLARWDAEAYPPVEHQDQAPLKLTVNKPIKMWANGLLSSQEWSGQFYRYLTPAFDFAADQARGRVNWWHVPYVLERVRQDKRINYVHLVALLAVRVHGLAWDVAFERYHCTNVQLSRLEARITRTYIGYL